jgi:hypothetical protein
MNKRVVRFPKTCLDADAVLSEITGLKSNNVTWKDGRLFGYIYHSPWIFKSLSFHGRAG